MLRSWAEGNRVYPPPHSGPVGGVRNAVETSSPQIPDGWIDALDIRGHLIGPIGQGLGGAVSGSSICTALRQRGSLPAPGHDSRVILVSDAGVRVDPIKQVGDPVLVHCLITGSV